MPSKTQQFDICILCALYEEAKAVIEEFSIRCNVQFETAFTGFDHYEYLYTTIQNNQNEPLRVLVTWLSDSGPVQTGPYFKSLLQEFHPQFAAMTGICAGYKRKVRLGDLVIAEYAYHYEEGKVRINKDSQKEQIPEAKTHDTTPQAIQYAKGFEAWKEPVVEMKRLKLKREELKDSEQPRCLVAPMASGMAVRSDNPFPRLIKFLNRKTVALDMEAAAFYRTLRGFPDIHALVVKGVCDYADMNKNDNYQEYAARASAIYLLRFIQHYVTNTTMPRRDDHQSQRRSLNIYLDQKALHGYGNPNPTALTFYICNNVDAPPIYISHIGLEAMIDGELRTVICEISPRFSPTNPYLKEEGPLEPGRGRLYPVHAPRLSAQLQACGENIVLKEAFVEDENRNRYSTAISHDLAMWLLSFSPARKYPYSLF